MNYLFRLAILIYLVISMDAALIAKTHSKQSLSAQQAIAVIQSKNGSDVSGMVLFTQEKDRVRIDFDIQMETKYRRIRQCP